MLQKANARIKRHLRAYLDQNSSRLGYNTFSNGSPVQEAPETFFKTSDGREIPVYKDHRYGLKKCWSVFGPMAALAELNRKNLLAKEDQDFFKEAKGHRTIGFSFDEIRARIQPYLERYEDLFISTKIPDIGKRLMKPSPDEVESVIRRKTKEHEYLVEKISSLVEAPPKAGEKALEVGYTSGGQSVIALERAGFQAIGIDNFYHDSIEAMKRHEYIADIVKTKTEFLVGDVTKETEVEEGSCAFIYTLSVIEHIMDLPAAFAEMYRMLRPGGVMFHRYDPYFHILGAHSHSTLDAPWAHMRMSMEDTCRYIKELRPHEAEYSVPWVENALNRNHTQTHIQQLLVEQGFNIRLWEADSVKPDYLDKLTPETLNECLQANPNVGLIDLTTSAVSFVAEKPV